jgi:hypothetical protein
MEIPVQISRPVFRFAFGILAMIATTAPVPCLYADIVLPPAQFQGNAAQITITGPGTSTSTNYIGDEMTTFTLSFTATETLLGPDDYAYTEGDASVSGGGTAAAGGITDGGGSVTYYYMVSGSLSEPVPLLIDASGSVSASGTGTVNAVLESAAGDLCATTVNGGDCGNPGSLAFSSSPISFDATPGTLYSIVVSVVGGADGTGSWSGSVDPQVEINPSFADASDFTVAFSQSASTSAPEPGSLGLIVAGMALLGGLFWLKRRSPQGTVLPSGAPFSALRNG